MGRIKSTLVKRTSKELLKEHPFSDSFEKNKKFLSDTMPSKRIRNKVAGYITRLHKMKKAAEKEIFAQQPETVENESH